MQPRDCSRIAHNGLCISWRQKGIKDDFSLRIILISIGLQAGLIDILLVKGGVDDG